jgi:Domain of unknown function (DUF5664)
MTKVTFESGAERGTEVIKGYHMLSQIALRRYADVMNEGAAKYTPYNWLKGFPVHNLIDHLYAHLAYFLQGDASEDHLGHALWNLAAVLHYSETRLDLFEGLPPGCKDAMVEFLQNTDEGTPGRDDSVSSPKEFPKGKIDEFPYGGICRNCNSIVSAKTQHRWVSPGFCHVSTTEVPILSQPSPQEDAADANRPDAPVIAASGHEPPARESTSVSILEQRISDLSTELRNEKRWREADRQEINALTSKLTKAELRITSLKGVIGGKLNEVLQLLKISEQQSPQKIVDDLLRYYSILLQAIYTHEVDLQKINNLEKELEAHKIVNKNLGEQLREYQGVKPISTPSAEQDVIPMANCRYCKMPVPLDELHSCTFINPYASDSSAESNPLSSEIRAAVEQRQGHPGSSIEALLTFEDCLSYSRQSLIRCQSKPHEFEAWCHDYLPLLINIISAMHEIALETIKNPDPSLPSPVGEGIRKCVSYEMEQKYNLQLECDQICLDFKRVTARYIPKDTVTGIATELRNAIKKITKPIKDSDHEVDVL